MKRVCDIDNTTDAQSLELYNNTTGRQANRGMEGLAITPDGMTLVGIMQNALLQDHGVNVRHVLFVASDNDLALGLQTQIYAFAIDGTAAGLTFERQQVGGPMIPVPPGGRGGPGPGGRGNPPGGRGNQP